ncbi:MAG: hypothetical protein ACXWXK_05080 [Actinomycetota bacterium]
MLALRADPWTPDHGMGFEARLDETPASADPGVETGDWTSPIRPAAAEPGTVWFVDGVRRIELRVLADDDGRRAPGLFGSWAVGAVRCDARAEFGEHEVGRCVVLGGGIRPAAFGIDAGSHRLRYEPVVEPGTDPDAPLFGLQKRMQHAEAALAARTAGETGGLVLADGRLGFLDATASPVVGVVKRFVRAYLDVEHDALVARLAPGERTPLFGLVYEGQPLERYAWYTRLVPSRPAWHDHAGLVRCEVRAGVGVDEARSLADRVSALLPRFAGRRSDPRYPQNLAPVGGLESWLQHRMGHRGLIRRALMVWLTTGAHPAAVAGGG